MKIINVSKENNKAILELSSDEMVTICNALNSSNSNEVNIKKIYKILGDLVLKILL